MDIDVKTLSDPEEDQGAAFLGALFEPDDYVHFRPIETWTEDGRKSSRVIRNEMHTRRLSRIDLPSVLAHLQKVSEENKANIFFGVCPRFGGNGKYNESWQIRSVRALWADLDHVTVEKALGRVSDSGLPGPSIVVNSGNGVHLYWLLDEPYLIDDAGDPLPVEFMWVTDTAGGKKPRKYVMSHDEQVFLDQRPPIVQLSPKARHIQAVLSGISKACGGDHTTDLARLLRIPGTMNRKDERNGHEPRWATLVECDPTRRYPLTIFERFVVIPRNPDRDESPPGPRRPGNATDLESRQFEELITRSGELPVGQRSEADFALCQHAIRGGIDIELVWTRVQYVGKFAQEGRGYFDRTWNNATKSVHSGSLGQIHGEPKARASEFQEQPNASDGNAEKPPTEGAEVADDSDGPVIEVNPQTTPVRETVRAVTDRLVLAGNCFNRADQLVEIHLDQIHSIITSAELAGLLNKHVEFFFVEKSSCQFKPFPTNYGNTWLNRRDERARLPAITLFTRNPVYTLDWRLVVPGFDSDSGIYYSGPPVAPINGTSRLDALLRDFCFEAPADRTNYIAMLLTAVLMPHFIGSKPAALFNGNQPGLGKSMLAQIIAILRDGRPSDTATYNPNDEEFEKRLGSIVRSGSTTITIDNAKARGRHPRIDSPCLERSITDPILSFRLLGHSSSIRVENSHIFCITANSADVSLDLMTRSVVINLLHEGNPTSREFKIADPESYAQEHRSELLGELIGMVERWKAAGRPLAKVKTRFNKRGWGDVIGGILQACNEPDFLANAEESAVQLDETRRDFVELIVMLVDHPQGTWTALELANFAEGHRLLAADLGDGSPRSRATKMGTLAGRFVRDGFQLADGREVVFHKTTDRKGHIYRVDVRETAEP